jgi:serine/threonine protein kinase
MNQHSSPTILRLSESEAKPLILQLITAIHCLHEKSIAHRDLKLANILITNSFQIKVCDFGISKICGNNQRMTSFCGTPYFIAPEIFNEEGYNEKCDIWSLGIIFYQILFGQFPKLKDMRFEDISPELKDMILSMLMVDPDDRISSEQLIKHPWTLKH